MRLWPQLPHSVIPPYEPQALLRWHRSKSLSCVVSSHRRISSSRKRHCLPIFSAGISPHSAQKQTVRGDIPNHRATVAVERNGSCCSPLELRIAEPGSPLTQGARRSDHQASGLKYRPRLGTAIPWDSQAHRAIRFCNKSLSRFPQLVQNAHQIAQQAPQLVHQIPQLIQQNPQLAQQAPQLQQVPQLLQQAAILAQQIPHVLQALCTSPHNQGVAVGAGPFFGSAGGFRPLGYGQPVFS
jgi:hypothetical protein